MAEETRLADGFDRWERLKTNEYQDIADIAAERRRLQDERERESEARRLSESGPLSLTTCLAFALEFSDEIQAKREAMRSAGGERLVVKSRFLPHLTYNLAHESAELDGDPTVLAVATTNETVDTRHSLRLSQTIFEFGGDNDADAALRESERHALFDYENKVRDVLSGARHKFFTILLRRQQLAERRKLLAEFRARHDQIRELEKSRRVLEVDVLTARLNVLNEEANINSLQREILRQNIDLLHLMGLPVGMTGLDIGGQTETFGVALPDCVAIGLRRSSSVASARAAVEEQARAVRDTYWDYAPDLGLQAAWKNDRTISGIELNGDNGNYAGIAFAEMHADPFDGHMYTQQDLLAEDEEGWFVALSLELPLFEGLAIRGARQKAEALLAQRRHELRNEINTVESGVRKAYQTMLERRKEVEILRDRVLISRERLKVQEKLKELGKINDNELETFRNQFFQDQDTFFTQQISLVRAQEDLRATMRYFEPLPVPSEEAADTAN